MSKKDRSSLGRGLDALISTDYLSIETQGSSSINEISLSDIIPNEEQPRTFFEEETLVELADSIRHIGIVQPITVYGIPEEPGRFRIISGERRYRAAKIAGLESIPAYVRTAEDEQVMEMALIENIQREDLNAIEISLAFKKLIDTYHLTQDDLSARVGKKRATISNYLRLLKLPAEVQMGLKNSKIDMGHARALLSLDDTELLLALYEQTVKEGLSVRQVEEIVRSYNEGQKPASTPKKQSSVKTPEEFALLSQHFSSIFKTKVSMTCNDKGKGKITIPFASEEQLEAILSTLDKL
ncbi:chromosome partitioning protein ParB [Porphyromonas cangingivalis]|uniref:Chromosome partitioning protein ParB n=1 Tax=Porphyromonas cangingivalis TaxID=36874 RepID=A0A0A2EKT6_PORCN|nr:ParB/RepB/Spo0J family partition protein [Porphyromonas cangingivalis]KGN79451.1 chromosome partitioning protein ParB [Porphyromonas cangingivalis]